MEPAAPRTSSRPAHLVLVTAILVLLAYSIHLSSTLVAIMQALILVGVFAYFLVLGRRYPMLWRHGWSYIVIGVNLVTFSGLIDISEHVPFLSSKLTAAGSPFRVFIGQVVGKMAGSLMLAFGFYRWVPAFLESRAVLEEMAHDMELQLRSQADALREAEELLRLQSLNRTILETVPLGVLATDDESRIVSANPALTTLTGTAPDRIVGQRLDDVFRDSTLGARLAEMGARNQPGLQVSEMEGVALAAGTRDLRVLIARPAQGPLVCVIEDVTDRNAATRTEKLFQEQLIKNEKLTSLGSMVSGVAHELNNPLCIILGYTDVLTQPGGSPTVTTKALTAMQNAAIRCQKIVANLLSFARQQAPERKLVNIADLLEEAIQLRAAQCAARGITIRRELERTPETMADGHQLLQVFFNLINNAYQAMSDHSGERTLIVSCRERTGMIVAEVADTGPGIPREIRSKVFDPFFTTKEVGVGTGLGLSICFGIMHAHGGDIRVDSREGAGSRFICELPVCYSQSTGLQTLARTADHDRLAGKRILVVDDEKELVELCRAYLSSHGMQIEHCNTGDQALKRLLEETFDLVLLDLRLPGVGGREVYERLRQRFPERARSVAFMTGDTADEAVLEFLKASERRYVFKPFRTSMLDELLSGHFAEAPGTVQR